MEDLPISHAPQRKDSHSFVYLYITLFKEATKKKKRQNANKKVRSLSCLSACHMFLSLLKTVIKIYVLKYPYACYSEGGCGERVEQVRLAVKLAVIIES